MNGYISVQEAAEKWNITPRQVQILCKEGRIRGAEMMSRIWIIPKKSDNTLTTEKWIDCVLGLIQIIEIIQSTKLNRYA